MKVSQKLNELYEKMGVDPKIEKFSNRKLLQKLTYLFEVFGLDLRFRFHWYLHGPYDKQLTKILYKDPDAKDYDVPSKFANENKKIVLLKNFLGSEINSRSLELIVSLHYLLVLAHTSKQPEEEVINKLLELKPQFTRDEANYFLKRIKEFIPL